MEYYKSIDPYREETIAVQAVDSDELLEEKLSFANQLNFNSADYSFEKRLAAIQSLESLLKDRRDHLARDISREMGKPLKEALAEIDKCAWLCSYYHDEAPKILVDQQLDLGEATAIRRYEPLGSILGIMPWNFPFWQVFRFAVPAILAGNKVLLKHAPICVLSAKALQALFNDSGLPQGAYQAVYWTNEQVANALEDPRVHGLSLTGSTRAGKAVAEKAASCLKPQLLELGGSNAFILHESALVEKAAALAGVARLLNAGQSCIAAKRFLVPEKMVEDFTEALIAVFEQYKLGDPLEEGTSIGPLARRDLKEQAEIQVERSLAMGAHLAFGCTGEGNFVEPTILTNISTDMPVFKEEVFAPVASIIGYSDFEEAIALSNASAYGLGVSLIGEDVDFLLAQASRFEEGAVFINELVKSDPRLPFGGVKSSGYGRELGPEGLISFTNLKTIYRKDSLK